jgi:predicted dehydrogenase
LAEASADAFHTTGYADHRELIADESVNVVVVAVRVPLHFQPTMDALAAGKNVYTEWPLGANVAEAEQIVSLANKQRVKTIIGLQGRMASGHQLLKEMVEDGYVGRMLHCSLVQFTAGAPNRLSSFSWQAAPGCGYSALTVPFGHAIDAVCQSVGPLTELEATLSNQFPEWHETDTGNTINSAMVDTVMVNGLLANGATMSAHVGMNAPHHTSGFRLEVYGTGGTVVLTSPQRGQLGRVRVFGGRGSDKELAEVPVPDHLQESSGLPDPMPNIARLYGKIAEAVGGGSDVHPDFEDALRLHRFLAVIEDASASGQRKTVPANAAMGAA